MTRLSIARLFRTRRSWRRLGQPCGLRSAAVRSYCMISRYLTACRQSASRGGSLAQRDCYAFVPERGGCDAEVRRVLLCTIWPAEC